MKHIDKDFEGKSKTEINEILDAYNDYKGVGGWALAIPAPTLKEELVYRKRTFEGLDFEDLVRLTFVHSGLTIENVVRTRLRTNQ